MDYIIAFFFKKKTEKSGASNGCHISAIDRDLLNILCLFLFSEEKNPKILALKFEHFQIPLQRSLHKKEENIALKWHRPSSPIKPIPAEQKIFT